MIDDHLVEIAMDGYALGWKTNRELCRPCRSAWVGFIYGLRADF
jgi:hypothetical protein